MRYLIQIAVMSTDIILLAVALGIVYVGRNFGPIGMLFMAFVFAAFLKSWKRNGGLMAWRPKTVRQFLRNAKQYGL